MIGTFADVVFADAIVKEIPGFDYADAWLAMKKDSFTASPDKMRGKVGLQLYVEKGFIPMDAGVDEACSRTLDFAFSDAAVAAAADRLGYTKDAEALRARSVRALRKMYDKTARLLGRRKEDGKFEKHSRYKGASTWGDCFTEGSQWHHSFPPYNLSALADVYGGAPAVLERLHDLFSTSGDFDVGSYRLEIHEMREMRMLGMGQYAHNNQPVHHLPYLFALFGDHNTTAKLIRRILARAYSPAGFAGDEDNGEMGSWYVLSALGLYSVAPGVSEDYVLGAVPLFPRVHLKELDVMIEAPSAEQEEPALAGVLWKNQPLTSVQVPYSSLRTGGVLRFVVPGDPSLGRLVSSLRGALHTAIKRFRPEETNEADDAKREYPPILALVALAVVSAFAVLTCWRRCGNASASSSDHVD